ncbi:MAG: hypothetical protein WCG25_07000 [bacterium]
MLVFSHHRAARFIPVRTTSFHHDAENWFISAIISSSGLDQCFHLFIIVRQNVQKLSQPFWMRINFLVYILFPYSNVEVFDFLGCSGSRKS